MGRRRKPNGRALNGILLLDKELGVSSNSALQRAKRLFKAAKAGHTGNLDPLATGMLPICFGEATKLSNYLLDADKVYIGLCKLGSRTTTADREGEVIDTRPVPELTEAQLQPILEQFTGEIEQIPPMYSAIKHQGTPLYKLARKGEEVERKSRTVTIHSLELLRLEGDEIELKVHCSKGTYIRTLVEDIGEVIGCGAHLGALRRTRVGPFQQQDMVTIEQIEVALEPEGGSADALLLPMDSALSGWNIVSLSDTSMFYIRQGQPIQVSQAPDEGLVQLMGPGDNFIGIGHILPDGRVAPKRLIQE